MKNEIIDELKVAQQKLCILEDINIAYREAINEVDDYFEYRNESKKDREFIHKVLIKLTNRLSRI